MSTDSRSHARKVLHLIDTGGPGGAETVFSRLASAFRDRGWVSEPCVSREGWLSEQLRAAELVPAIVKSRGVPGHRYLAAIVGLIRRTRPDLVIAHLFGASVYASLAGILTRTPVVAVLHGQTDLAGDHRGFWLKRQALRRCAAVVYVADSLAEELQPRLGIAPRRALVIPNGVNIRRFSPGRESVWRERLGVEPESCLIGAVGNIRAPKAYDVLIDAAAQVLPEAPGAFFAVAGDGPPEALEALQARVRDRALTDRFRFLGHVEDTASFLRSLDVFVMSSRSEGLPLACLEAMACGLPVVSTRCGGPERIITPGVEGALVPVNAPSELAKALLAVLSDEAQRRSMGEAARSKVVAGFSEDAMAEAYFRLADRILAA